MNSARTLAAAAMLAAPLAASTAHAGVIVFEPPFTFPVGGCGEVVFDETCRKLFKLDGQGYYTFPGLSQFDVGDRLHVEGGVCLICLLTPCGTPYSAMLSATISRCDVGQGGVAGSSFEGCVEVVANPECGALLVADGGEVFYGEGFVSVEQAGLRFHASGELSPLQVLCGKSPVPDVFPFFVELSLSGCTGDLNVDGIVDGADLAQLLAAWGPCDDQGSCPADLDGDHDVDGADLAALLAAWSG